MKELEYTVFRRNQKLAIFDEIDERIANIERTRAENESAIWWEIEAFKKINRDQSFDNENKKMQIESLEKSRETLLAEIQRMKESYEGSKDQFIAIMKQEHNKMLDSIDELRKILERQEMQLNLTSSRGMSN